MKLTKTKEIILFDPTVFTQFHFYYIRHIQFEAICSCKTIEDDKAVFTVICYLNGVSFCNGDFVGEISINVQRNTFYDHLTFYIDGCNYVDFLHVEEMERIVGFDMSTGTPIVRIGMFNSNCKESNCKKVKLTKE